MSRKFLSRWSPRLFIFYCTVSSASFAQEPAGNEVFTVKEGLSENVVHCLLQDKQGFLWIGTHEGLNRYDGYGFKKFLHDKNDSVSLPNSPVEYLFEDDKGRLVIGTNSGLMNMDRQKGRFSSRHISLGEFEGKFSWLHPFLDNTAKGKINFDFAWQLYRVNKSLDPPLLTWIQQAAIQKPGTLAAHYDISNKLWLLSSDKLVVIDKLGQDTQILNGLSLENKVVRWFFDDSNDNIWLRLPGKIICIDKFSLEVKNTVYQSDLKDFPLENILSLLLDRSGVLWIGSFYGLKKVNLNRQQFNHIIFNGKETGLASNFILGMNLHSGNKLTVQHYFMDSFYSEVDLAGKNIRQFRIEKVSMEIFFKEVVIKNFDRVANDSWKIQLEKIYAAKPDRRMIRYAYADREGAIWSFYNQTSIINFKDNRTVRIEKSAECFLDDEKWLWIATTNEGLIRLTKSTGEQKRYRATTSDSSGISTDNLNCLTPAGDGNFWIGTRAGGLIYFDREKETFRTYTEADGLASNTIYCMVEDNTHKLWMGTAKGLSCLDPVAGAFRNFYVSDGLMNTEFNRWSAVKDSAGLLYFGGMNGIDYFNPEEVLFSKNKAPVVQLTAFKTGNQSQFLEQGQALNHKQNFISFDFAAMDFRNPAATQYMYKLEGSTNDWIHAESNHSAVFASLPPGNYIFKVKAATQNGIWSDENTLAFRILSPWWQRGWFYAICALAVLAWLYAFYTFRINQLKKVMTVRTKISQDLHDDMGATLSGIAMYSHLTREQIKAQQPEEVSRSLDVIQQSATEMVNKLNDIVWVVNPRHDSVQKLLQKLEEYATEMAAVKKIKVQTDMSEKISDLKLPMQSRRSIYLVCKEAINNAVKYSECSLLDLQVQVQDHAVEFSIKDNGKGFTESGVKKGNGLINMEQRAAEIGAVLRVNSEPGQGTKISLRYKIPH